MERFPLHVISLLSGLMLLSSCRDNPGASLPESGKLEYRITYLDGGFDATLRAMLPKSMDLAFSRKAAVNSIDGFLGIYRLNSMTDFSTRRCSTYLKVFDSNYLCNGRRGEPMCFFDAMEGMKIEETGEYTVIAGLNCRRAVVTLPATGDTFDIYYTRDIRLRHPNMNNPYSQVDGVLVRFRMHMLGVKMELTAEHFGPLQEGSDRLEVPRNTREVSRQQMTEILARLME